MTEIVNLSISQSAASELSRQASFGGSPGVTLYADEKSLIYLKI